MNDTTFAADADGLSGVPGLGPVRRRLLAEAGITTRAELARATPEQIISATGMPRGVAEQVSEFVRSSSLSPLSPHPFPPSEGEKGEQDTGVASLPASPSGSPFSPSEGGKGWGDRGDDRDAAPGEDAPSTTRLERAALRAQTAIADASRRAAPESKLSAMLLRFAQLTDELPRRVTAETRGGVLRRITDRIEAITERLETVAVAKAEKKSGPLSSKRAKRLEQRLKRTRDSIKRTLKASASN